MAKKSFKGGLDNLLASAGLKKKSEEKKPVEKKIDTDQKLSDDNKHWIMIQMDKLNQELRLWRTGQINVQEFHDSLKKHGLKYNVDTNEIEEI